MANSSQSIKRVRQALTRKTRNQPIRTYYRTTIKQARADVTDAEKASDSFKRMQSVIDRTARKGLVHKNTVARLKNRINRAIRQSVANASS